MGCLEFRKLLRHRRESLENFGLAGLATTDVVYHHLLAAAVEDNGDISLGFSHIWACKKKWSIRHFIVLVWQDTCRFFSRWIAWTTQIVQL